MNINSPLYMNVKEIVDENFQDYKKASMFIATVKCDFKCLKEKGLDFSICQNSKIAKLPDKKVFIPDIFQRYIKNPLTSAVVVGGLEPMLQFEEVLNLVSYFRENNCSDDFVIYTGYYAEEITSKLKLLQNFNNIIIKYGRFIPDSNPVFDDVLGINLNSENQHAVKIS
ncbi:MAG: 4Fe-4S cluster-binding domain-containing protein [Clostridia bacterium]|nr:4Fe-4S cluster-binding domain-containing protein [Clostridia bacterium]